MNRVGRQSKAVLRLLLAVVLAASCLAAAQQDNQPNPTGAAQPTAQAPSQPPPPAQPSDKEPPEVKITPRQAEELFHSVDEILEFDSKQTGMPIRHGVKRKLSSRDEVVAFLTKHMNDEDTQRLRRSEIVLKKFGLLPQDFKLETFLVALLREEVAGYYDPKTKTVNLLDWVPMEEQEPVVAHELTHALQDQTIGLEKWMKAGDKDLTTIHRDLKPSDIVADETDDVREAVIEGQAQAMMFQYALAPAGRSITDSPGLVQSMEEQSITGTPGTKVFDEAPMFLKESMTFPYSYGMEFVIKVLEASGKERAFAGMLENPPQTTRQIMQPETYLSSERIAPMPIPNFKRDFKDYQKLDIGAMGEFDVDMLIEQYAGKPAARQLYPAWRGGYYYAVLPKPDPNANVAINGPIGVLYASRWSDAEKAAEFAGVYARALKSRYKKLEGEPLADQSPGDRSAGDQPPAPSAEGKPHIKIEKQDEKDAPVKIDPLPGRHNWTTEEGFVVIEARGDTVFVSENLDAATTATLEKEVLASSSPGK
jgi:hypothetical protein